MKWKIVLAIVALTVATQATADEHRGGDAALGALSGAVVLGPIGAVAGAVVGYTAGPSIAHAWGFRRGGTAHHTARQVRQETQGAPAQVTPASATVSATSQQHPAASARTASSKPPPMQGLE
jgi:outer membrane lipoprotein SlyB